MQSSVTKIILSLVLIASTTPLYSSKQVPLDVHEAERWATDDASSSSFGYGFKCGFGGAVVGAAILGVVGAATEGSEGGLIGAATGFAVGYLLVGFLAAMISMPGYLEEFRKEYINHMASSRFDRVKEIYNEIKRHLQRIKQNTNIVELVAWKEKLETKLNEVQLVIDTIKVRPAHSGSGASTDHLFKLFTELKEGMGDTIYLIQERINELQDRCCDVPSGN